MCSIKNRIIILLHSLQVDNVVKSKFVEVRTLYTLFLEFFDFRNESAVHTDDNYYYNVLTFVIYKNNMMKTTRSVVQSDRPIPDLG